MRPWLRQFVVVGLLIFGVEAWLTLLHAIYGRYYEPRVLLYSLIVAAIWPVSKWFGGRDVVRRIFGAATGADGVGYRRGDVPLSTVSAD